MALHCIEHGSPYRAWFSIYISICLAIYPFYMAAFPVLFVRFHFGSIYGSIPSGAWLSFERAWLCAARVQPCAVVDNQTKFGRFRGPETVEILRRCISASTW